jgi:Flp pilus assembly protein protease CpaA
VKTALFIFVLSIAGSITVAYLTAAVIAVVKRTRLSGCGWIWLTWFAVLAVWTLLYVAGQISGTSVVPSPW